MSNYYHAELRNARWQDRGDEKALVGQVYGDKKERFEDGEWVMTSLVQNNLPGGLYMTNNSTYKVTSWSAPPAEGGVE